MKAALFTIRNALCKPSSRVQIMNCAATEPIDFESDFATRARVEMERGLILVRGRLSLPKPCQKVLPKLPPVLWLTSNS
jgi:hypothetical protein